MKRNYTRTTSVGPRQLMDQLQIERIRRILTSSQKTPDELQVIVKWLVVSLPSGDVFLRSERVCQRIWILS